MASLCIILDFKVLNKSQWRAWKVLRERVQGIYHDNRTGVYTLEEDMLFIRPLA